MTDAKTVPLDEHFEVFRWSFGRKQWVEWKFRDSPFWFRELAQFAYQEDLTRIVVRRKGEPGQQSEVHRGAEQWMLTRKRYPSETLEGFGT